MDDRAAAYILFEAGATNKEIATTLHRTQKTIGNWRRDDNWDAKRAADSLVMRSIKDNVYDLITYQLAALRKLKEGYEHDGGTTLISRGDIDGLAKLFSAVREKELEWSQIVKVLREFMTWLKAKNIEVAKDLTDFVDDYLNVKRKNM